MLERVIEWRRKDKEKNEVWGVCPIPPYVIVRMRWFVRGGTFVSIAWAILWIITVSHSMEDCMTFALFVVCIALIELSLEKFERHLQDITNSLGLPLGWLDECMFDIFDQIEEAYQYA